MAKYEYLILDEDDTLLNFEKCELNAFLRTMEACKIVPEERLQKLFIEICDEVWLKYDLDNTNNADILKNYHKYYRSYAVERFVHLEEKIKTGMPPEQLSALYFRSIKKSSGRKTVPLQCAGHCQNTASWYLPQTVWQRYSALVYLRL